MLRPCSTVAEPVTVKGVMLSPKESEALTVKVQAPVVAELDLSPRTGKVAPMSTATAELVVLLDGPMPLGRTSVDVPVTVPEFGVAVEVKLDRLVPAPRPVP